MFLDVEVEVVDKESRIGGNPRRFGIAEAPHCAPNWEILTDEQERLPSYASFLLWL
jgi:hypothetical protein